MYATEGHILNVPIIRLLSALILFFISTSQKGILPKLAFLGAGEVPAKTLVTMIFSPFLLGFLLLN